MPSATMMPEKRNAYRRLPMKSMFVFPRISNMPAPSRSAPSAEITSQYLRILNTQLLDLAALIDDVENDLGPHQCRKQIDCDAETERDGESLDRPGAEQKERHTGDQGRDVRIDDG